MEKRDNLTKFLAIAGTVLTWIPILAPFTFGILFFIRSGQFHFDYLMPAELFFVALAGAALLLWASLRARAYRKVIAWGLGLAILLLVGSQVIAVVTGLASGATEPTGWQWMLVLGMLIVYAMALIMIGVGGILLLRDLFKKNAPAANNK